MKVLVFSSPYHYEQVLLKSTASTVFVEHIFVKLDGDKYLAKKGPYSGKVLTERAVQRLQSEDV